MMHQNVASLTFAHSAEYSIGPQSASFFGVSSSEESNDPRRIVTPLKVDKWRELLGRFNLLDKHQHILPLIISGFPMHCDWKLSSLLIYRNHSSATNFPDAIEKYIEKERPLGRYSEPFTHKELEATIGWFYCAPLGTVEKSSAPNERRIVQDDSFPKNNPSSLNANITSQNHLISWTTFPEFAQMVTAALPGSRAGSFDGNAAYRMCPTKVEDQNWMVIGWRDRFYVDRCKHFGEKNGGVPHGMVAEALLDILRAKFKSTQAGKWADDFVFIQHPTTTPTIEPPCYECDLQDLISTAAYVGYFTSEKKSQQFGPKVEYLGFIWDLSSTAVWVTERKRSKYLTLLVKVLSQRDENGVFWMLPEAERLTGYLGHIQIAVRGTTAPVNFSLCFPHWENRGKSHLIQMWRG
jgi:hypothetical protein